MSNIKIERSRIQKIIEDYVKGMQNEALYVKPLMSIDELTDEIWKYIEEIIRKAKYPSFISIID